MVHKLGEIFLVGHKQGSRRTDFFVSDDDDVPCDDGNNFRHPPKKRSSFVHFPFSRRSILCLRWYEFLCENDDDVANFTTSTGAPTLNILHIFPGYYLCIGIWCQSCHFQPPPLNYWRWEEKSLLEQLCSSQAVFRFYTRFSEREMVYIYLRKKLLGRRLVNIFFDVLVVMMMMMMM